MVGHKVEDHEEAMKRLLLFDEAQVIAKGLESDIYNKKADEKKEKAALDALFNDSYYEDGSPRYTKPEYDALAENQQNEARELAFSTRSRGKTLADVVNTLAKETDKVIGDKSKLVNVALDVASNEEAVSSIPKNERAIFEDYVNYSQIDRIVKDLESGRKIDPKQEQDIIKLAQSGAYKLQYDAFKKMGYREDLAELAGKLAMIGTGNTKEEQIAGAKKLRDNAEKDLGKKYGRNYKNKVADVIANTIREMADSSDAKKEKIAASLFYKAHKGYALGERDFKEAF